jgi:hypothetical protein
MSNQKIKSLLEQLRTEMESVDKLDEAGLAMLRELDGDIDKLIARSDDDVSNQSIAERLDEAVSKFEVTHPTLTAMLSEISKILSNAGI